MMFVMFAIAIPMPIRTNDVDPPVFIDAKVFRCIERLKTKGMQPFHRLSPRLGIHRLKFGFEFPGRELLDGEGIPFAERPL